jgi:DNA-directed RNA polymerase II subunit RPB3
MEVTSADLQIVDSSGRNALVLPVNNENDHVLLCKLGKNQELVLEATASKGIGKEHSKWCPVAVATFQYIPEVTLNHAQLDQLNANEMVSFVNSCPRQVFSYLEAQRTVNIDNPEACIFCDECVRRAEDLKRPNLVSIKMKEGRFLFSVETNGSLTPDQVLMHAIRILHRKISVVEEELIHLQGGVGGGMPSNAPFGAMGYGGYPRYV